MFDALWKEFGLWIDKLPEPMKKVFIRTRDYVRIDSGESKNKQEDRWFARARTGRKEEPEALSGLHSDNIMIICDEASGIPDEVFEAAK